MKSLVTLLIICAFLASMAMISEQAEAVSPQTIDIAPNGYLVIQFSGSASSPSSYEVTVVSGPNIDVVLTDVAGYVAYMNNKSVSIPYSVLGTYLDTGHAAYYGDLPNDTYCLIIDNTVYGTAQPNGQTVRVTYSWGAGGAGIPPRWDFFNSIYGILLISGLVILIGIVAFIILAKNSKSSGMRQFPIPFLNRRSSNPVDQASPTPTFADPQKPHRIYLQAQATVRPILVLAIGRCPQCNGIIAVDWTKCTKCGWLVDRSKLHPLENNLKQQGP